MGFYGISRIFQGIKVTVATIGLVGSVLVIGWGAAAGKVIYIVGGSLCLAQSGFLFLDSSKVLQDIRKQVDLLKNSITDFQQQNQVLRENVTDLSEAKDKIVEQAHKLEGSLVKEQAQIEQLEALKHEYLAANETLQAQIEQDKKQLADLGNQATVYRVQNKELELSVQRLKDLEERLIQENSEYRSTAADNQIQLQELERLKEEYEAENLRLQRAVQDHLADIAEFQEQNKVLDGTVENFRSENETLKELRTQDQAQLKHLEQQVLKLKELYDNAKQLMVNLATAGDMFNQFSQSIDSSSIQLQETATELEETGSGLDHTLEAMKSLLLKLKSSTFGKLDTNQDGVISPEEFSQNVENL